MENNILQITTGHKREPYHLCIHNIVKETPVSYKKLYFDASQQGNSQRKFFSWLVILWNFEYISLPVILSLSLSYMRTRVHTHVHMH